MEKPDKGHEILGARPAMHETIERGRPAPGLEIPYEAGGMRSHDREQPLDRLKNARDTSKCKGSRTEPDDFPIVGS